QMAQTRTACAKILRRPLDHCPEGTQQSRATGQANEGIGSADLEGLCQDRFCDALQASRVCLPGVVSPTRKQASAESVKTGDSEALRTGVRLAAARLVVIPVRASASIKEDARHHQIKVAAGALGRTAGTELLVEMGDPVETTRVKMAPAAVERHSQIGIGVTR